MLLSKLITSYSCQSVLRSVSPVSRSFARLSSRKAQFAGANGGGGLLGVQHLVKPFLFTVTFCGASFTVATIWRYENSPQFDLIRARKNPDWLSKIKELSSLQGDGFKVFLGIAFLNCLVFLGWRVPKLYMVMTRYFMSNIESKSIRCLPMFLSNFSHYSLTHLGLNMIVLYSFSNIGVHLYGKENFLALYLSAGVVSSFASYSYKVMTRALSPSLGASGAILGILAATCVERPNIQLMIIFLPFFSFSAATALKGIILFDTIGLITRWAFFDHAAHLGGTLFGVYYAHDLKQLFRDKQSTIVKYWKDFKRIL